MRRHDAVAGVYGNDETGPELLYGAQPELPALDRRRADHHAARPGPPHGTEIFEGADAAADLNRHAYGAGYLGDQIQLHRPSLASAVEIDNVQRPRPASLPLTGTLDGIGVVLLRTVEVPLHEPDAPAVPQINGREDREPAQEVRAHFRKFS